MITRLSTPALLGGGFLLLSTFALAQSPEANWPQWRGPLGSGAAPQGNPPVKWDANTNIQWQVRVADGPVPLHEDDRANVRATLDNKEDLFKPEMFANVTVYSGGDHMSVGVKKQALIYEADRVRLWVAGDDKTLELREVQTGLINGDYVEVKSNLKPGERVIVRGSLFIDRAASGT